jgi:hypothetical protein
MLAKLTESTKKWDQVLNKVKFAIKNSLHSSTGQSASVLLFGVHQKGEVNDEVRLVLETKNNN